MSDPLIEAGAVELARAIRETRASPLELVDACCAVIARRNGALNAIVTLAEESARQEAAIMTQEAQHGQLRGPLHGLPVVIKDITETKGLRTTWGSPKYAHHVPAHDAEVVRRLRAAGAIILGKTNTPEFAAGANTVNALFGATANPWDTARSPAGSSGGSAAAVSAGMAPLAHGTDFGCSIRIPASFCGLVGVRTTPGLIPNEPMRLPWDAGQVHGPLARSAEDAALMIDAMTGVDPYWPLSSPAPWASALSIVEGVNDLQGKRIAYVADLADIGVDDEVASLCRDAAHAMSATGAQVEEIALDVSEGFAAYKTLRSEWMVGQQYERLEMLDEFGPNLAGDVRNGLRLSVRETAAAEQARERVWSRFRHVLQRHDYILTPTAPVPPYPLTQNYPDAINGRRLDNYIDWIASCFLVTFVGFPAASAPAGYTRSGLPVGVQIVGRRFDEPGILGVARMLARCMPPRRAPLFG